MRMVIMLPAIPAVAAAIPQERILYKKGFIPRTSSTCGSEPVILKYIPFCVFVRKRIAAVIMQTVMQTEKTFTGSVLNTKQEDVSTPRVLKIRLDKSETSAPYNRLTAMAAIKRSAFVFSTIKANKSERAVTVMQLKQIPQKIEPVNTVKV